MTTSLEIPDGEVNVVCPRSTDCNQLAWHPRPKTTYRPEQLRDLEGLYTQSPGMSWEWSEVAVIFASILPTQIMSTRASTFFRSPKSTSVSGEREYQYLGENVSLSATVFSVRVRWLRISVEFVQKLAFVAQPIFDQTRFDLESFSASTSWSLVLAATKHGEKLRWRLTQDNWLDHPISWDIAARNFLPISETERLICLPDLQRPRLAMLLFTLVSGRCRAFVGFVGSPRNHYFNQYISRRPKVFGLHR